MSQDTRWYRPELDDRRELFDAMNEKTLKRPNSKGL